MNRPPPDSIPDIEETNEDLNINCGRISKEEIKRAIKKLKLAKAPGIDNIPYDVLKGIMLLSVPSKILCRIILDRIQETVDKKLRKEQAGFRKDKSCTDHIATLRIIVKQYIEWHSSVYINFVDFEKAFDSIDRTVL